MKHHATFIFLIILFIVYSSCTAFRTRGNLTDEKITVRYTNNIRMKYPENFSYAELTVLVPGNYQNRQKIIAEEFSVKPSSIIKEGNNRYAVFDLSKGDITEINIVHTIELKRFDLSTQREKMYPVEELSDEDRINYLRAEKYLEVDDYELKEQAKQLTGSSELETVQNIYSFVKNHIKYSGVKTGNFGALHAFKTGKGDCTEFTDLFVALCRISSIPARFVEGCVVTGRYRLHAWAEAYITDYGWIPFDLMWDRYDNITHFDKLTNNYIYLTNIRNDSKLSDLQYYAMRYIPDMPVWHRIRYSTEIISRDTRP